MRSLCFSAVENNPVLFVTRFVAFVKLGILKSGSLKLPKFVVYESSIFPCLLLSINTATQIILMSEKLELKLLGL
jgi:hypothetical protein